MACERHPAKLQSHMCFSYRWQPVISKGSGIFTYPPSVQPWRKKAKLQKVNLSKHYKFSCQKVNNGRWLLPPFVSSSHSQAISTWWKLLKFPFRFFQSLYMFWIILSTCSDGAQEISQSSLMNSFLKVSILLESAVNLQISGFYEYFRCWLLLHREGRI